MGATRDLTDEFRQGNAHDQRSDRRFPLSAADQHLQGLTTMAKKAAVKLPKDFGSARQRLDEILAELENDGGDIDRLAERIKEAAALIRFCRERLGSARAEVRTVVAELDADQQVEATATASVDDDRPPPQEAPPGVSQDGDLNGPLDPGALGDGSLPF